MTTRNIVVVCYEAFLNGTALLLLVKYRTYTIGYICDQKWANQYISSSMPHCSDLGPERIEVRDL